MPTRWLDISYKDGRHTLRGLSFDEDVVADRLMRLAKKLHNEHITHVVSDGVLRVDYTEDIGGTYTLTAKFQPSDQSVVVGAHGSDDIMVGDAQAAMQGASSVNHGAISKAPSATSAAKDSQGGAEQNRLAQLDSDDSALPPGDDQSIFGEEQILTNDTEEQSSSRTGSPQRGGAVAKRAGVSILRQLLSDTSATGREGKATPKTSTSSKFISIEDHPGFESDVEADNQLGAMRSNIKQASKVLTQPCIDLTQDQPNQTSKPKKRKRQSSDVNIVSVKKLIIRLPCRSLIKDEESSASTSAKNHEHPPKTLPSQPVRTKQKPKPAATRPATAASKVKTEKASSKSKKFKTTVSVAQEFQSFCSVMRHTLAITRANFVIMKELVTRHMKRLKILGKDPTSLRGKPRQQWDRKLKLAIKCVMDELPKRKVLVFGAHVNLVQELGKRINDMVISGEKEIEDESEDEDVEAVDDCESESDGDGWDDSFVKYSERSSSESNDDEDSSEE